MRTYLSFVLTTTSVDVVRLVKVRAYTRVRNGKVERVSSHYRRFLGNPGYVS